VVFALCGMVMIQLGVSLSCMGKCSFQSESHYAY